MPLKIIFAGTPEFAVPCLQALINSEHDIVAVYTQPDRPAGRGRKLQASPVKQLAQQHHLPVVQAATLRTTEDLQQLKDFSADIMVVAAYGILLTEKALTTPHQGCINVHASLLPRWRGAAPIQHALLSGDTSTGITIMQMTRALDAGDMLAKHETPIGPQDTTPLLLSRLSQMGADLLIATLEKIENGTARAESQTQELVTYAHKINKADAEIDWQLSAVEIQRKIRAYNGWPVAFTHFNDKLLRIWQADLIAKSLNQPAGSLCLQGDELLVACSDGALRLRQVQLAGGRPLLIRDFINTYRKQLLTEQLRFN